MLHKKEDDFLAELMKKAIKETFTQMLERMPLKEITVKELTKECGINRNSFYYHYQDIPSLIEEIVKEHCDEVISRFPTLDSIEKCLSLAVEFTISKRRPLLHIYNSINRDIFERYLWQMCDYGIRTYVDTLLIDSLISDQDKESIIRFHKCECFGIIIDWLNSEMNEKVLESFSRIVSVRTDQISSTIKRLEELN